MRTLIAFCGRHPWLLPLAAIAFFTAVTLTMVTIAEAHPPQMLPGH